MSEFIADARVLITPDTTKFRGLLEAQLAAATAKPVVVPVTFVPTGAAGTAAATQATKAATAAATVQGVAAAKTSAATAALSHQQELAAKSAKALALAQGEVAGAASHVSAAQKTLTRSTAAVATAERELAAALKLKNQQSITAANESLRLARAQAAEAETALAAARAQAAHAASLGNVNKAAIASSAGFLGLRGAVLTAGAGFIAATVAFQAGIKAIQSAAQLETQLNVFKVTVGATSDEMRQAADSARALGSDLTLPGVTATEAAQAQLQLARAGLSVQEAIAGTRGSLQLATAAEIEFGRAADLVAGNLNAFGLAGDQAVRVADLLTGAANESQGSIEDMGIGLRQVAGAASLLGLTVEDTVALLTQLTRAGLAGSDAGTTLRVALVRLARPDTRKEVEKLVGSLQDLDGNLNPAKIVKLGEEIRKSGGKLDQTNRLYELFGENALRVIGLLGQEGVAGFKEISEATSESGLAAEVAGARMAGLEGDMEALSNEAAALGLTLGQLASPILSSLARGLSLTFGGVNLAVDAIRNLIDPPREAAKSIGEMRRELEEAQQDIERFRESSSGTPPPALQERLDTAAKAFERVGVSAQEAIGGISAFDIVARGVTGTIEGLVAALNKAAAPIRGGQARDSGLNVQQVLNRVTGFDSAETRARIRGSTEEILSVLQEEQGFLEAQLERDFVKRRPGLQRQLEDALFGVVNDIASITAAGAADAKQAAQEAAKAAQEADRALLDVLSQRRDDAQRKIAAAADTEGVQDDIRRQDALQALIKIQITKIRARIKDEETRRAAVRELRIALIASRQEEDALRAQQAQDRAAAKQENINLDISFAEITENTAREIAARLRLIALLKKQQKTVKRGTLEWKRLRNEIAEQQQAIKEAREEAEKEKDSGKTAQQFFFEQLQAQQGFASNLLGNLITGPTEGLVGVPAPSTPGRGVTQAAQIEKGKATLGPTAGQANVTNDILIRILGQLKELNGDQKNPEASRQRRSQNSVMDYQNTGGGYGF